MQEFRGPILGYISHTAACTRSSQSRALEPSPSPGPYQSALIHPPALLAGPALSSRRAGHLRSSSMIIHPLAPTPDRANSLRLMSIGIADRISDRKIVLLSWDGQGMSTISLEVQSPLGIPETRSYKGHPQQMGALCRWLQVRPRCGSNEHSGWNAQGVCPSTQ
jgi:hypothetical protein